MCQHFSLPDVSRDYHVIGSKPIIDNAYVMHHTLLFGCDEAMEPSEEASECGMAQENCRDIIAGWTVGANGECVDSEFGFRIGPTGYKSVMIQTHWNNPDKRDDYYDASGLQIYYTSALRPFDGGVMVTGQNHLVIPGNQNDVRIEGNCNTECTA